MQNLHLLQMILVFFYSLTFSQLVKLSLSQNQEMGVQYHMGPVLTTQINLYIIWYGKWNKTSRSTIKDFITSLSSPAPPSPSVSDWWNTVTLYTDQTNSSITKTIKLAGEFNDDEYSQGKNNTLQRLTMQSIIKNAVTVTPSNPNRGGGALPLPLDYTNGLYLVLTSSDVTVQDFCRGSVCGFHYFTFTSIVGATVPYAWVGDSGTQCPGTCAYPFAFPKYPTPPPGVKEMRPPNGDVGTDGMISVIAHELAEASSNPLINAWYGGDSPIMPNEIADLCQGIYGTGGGGSYMGAVSKDSRGNGYNLNGVKNSKFLVQWVWDHKKKRCYGPNTQD